MNNAGVIARTTPIRRMVPWLALALLAVLPYVGAMSSPLLYDDRTMLDNAWLAREAGPSSVFGHDFWFGSRHAGSELYRPLTVLSLAWNLRLAGSALGIRAVNAALHAIVVLLVAAFLRCVLRGRLPLRLDSPAWLGAALFAVHPLASESILWAVGRAEMLAAGFGLAAFLLIADSRRIPPLRLAGSLACFAAALLSKESAAAFVAIAFLWAWLGGADAAPSRRWAGPVAFAVVLIAFVGLRSAVVGGSVPAPPFLDNPLVAASAPTRVANAVLLHARYLAKMAVPYRLSIDYGFDQIAVVPLWFRGALGALAVSGAWLVVLMRLRRRSMAAAFLWAFAAAAFAVTSNLILPIGTIFAERLAYLPLVGFCGLAGYALAAIDPVRVRSAVVLTVLVAFAVRTSVRAADYRGLVTLTETTAAASPRSVKALLNLGRVRLEIQHRPADAIAPLTRAVAIWPDATRAATLLAKARDEVTKSSPEIPLGNR